MKTYYHKSDYGKIAIPCYNTKDLLSDTLKMWSWNRTFGTWDKYFDKIMPALRKKRYFKTRKYLIALLLKDIIEEFFTLLMEDLILHNDSYEFPDNLGKIQISYNHPDSAKYKYIIDRRGKTYKPVFVFTDNAYKKVKIQYYISFTRRWRKMFRDEYKNGHTYELVNYEHIKFNTTRPV